MDFRVYLPLPVEWWLEVWICLYCAKVQACSTKPNREWQKYLSDMLGASSFSSRDSTQLPLETKTGEPEITAQERGTRHLILVFVDTSSSLAKSASKVLTWPVRRQPRTRAIYWTKQSFGAVWFTRNSRCSVIFFPCLFHLERLWGKYLS